jgi:hypothetical protein
MTTKEKFDDFKVENLPEKTKETLLQLHRVTKGFTIDIPKAIKYVNFAYEKIKKEKPEFLISSKAIKPLNSKAYTLMKWEKFNLEREKERIETELKELEGKLKILKGAFEPHITITEVNTASMGHRFIGKFRVYFESKPRLMTISIGKFSDFGGIDDSRLVDIANEKAKTAVRDKFPDWF